MNLPTAASPRPAPAAPASLDGSRVLLAKIALALALLTFVIFLPVVSMNWVNFDDDIFVTNNPMVAPGLTWEGVKWAFTSTAIDFWRPLSWLSHMVDIELFGPVAGGHHLTNLLIHIAATVMLLLALHRLTGEVWPSAMVAALFAWHPLHVESVAWIAERKDVLCGFFWFYTIWAYAGYVARPDNKGYARVLVGFALGLMSKPMIVTLPCVLLLLDFWPLRRIELPTWPFWRSPGWAATRALGWQLLKEKIPLFAGVVVLSLSTFTAQREVGTMSDLPLQFRLASSVLGYAAYLRQTVWPDDLCVLYAYQATLPLWGTIPAILLLGSLSVLVLAGLRRSPYWLVGWLWFLGVLVPVVGIIQVGAQAHADRYTYVPLVGLFLAVVWGVTRWVRGRPSLRGCQTAIAAVVLLACAVTTRLQVRHWENSVELFARAVQVAPDNIIARNNLAAELVYLGKFSEAIPILEAGLKIDRRTFLLWNLAGAYLGASHPKLEPIVLEAFARDPFSPEADFVLLRLRTTVKKGGNLLRERKALASALAIRKDYLGAAHELQELTRVAPNDWEARTDQAAYLSVAGREIEALAILEATVKLAPTNSLARSNLGALLARKGRLPEAIAQYQAALILTPNNPDTRHNFALALARNQQVAEARVEFETVLRQEPDHLPALQQLAWLLATHPGGLDAPQALRLAQQARAIKATPGILDTLAAACAANGDFTGATQHATQALEMARRENQQALVNAIRSRIKLYQTGKPYQQTSVQGP